MTLSLASARSVDGEPGTYALTLNGIEQRIHVHGSGPVVVAHSGGPGISWNYLRMREVEEHATVIYLEPIGTHRSSRLPTHPDGYSVDVFVEQVHALAQALQLAPFHFLGHSHGGFIAQQYALTYPAELAGVVLYDSAPTFGAEAIDEASRLIGEFVQRNDSSPAALSVAAAWQAGLTDEDPASETDEALQEYLKALLPAYFADYWGQEDTAAAAREVTATVVRDSANPAFDVRSRLPEIEVPTLIICGEYDFICGPRWAREMHAGIPDAELVMLSHSGHFGHLEEPQAFAAAVAKFVRHE